MNTSLVRLIVATVVLMAAAERAAKSAVAPPTTQRQAATQPATSPALASFRNVPWGSTMQQVIAAEGKEPEAKGSKILLYDDNVAGLAVKVGYVFIDDVLVRGSYRVVEKHTNKTDYIDDYEKLCRQLATKYGKPAEDETIWKDDLYKDRPAQWGMAVATGRLVYMKRWHVAGTTILADLEGDNFEIKLQVDYKSDAHAPLVERERAAKDQKKL